MIESDFELSDGRKLHVYDTGARGDNHLVVFWQHGTPNIGAPPEPLLPASAVRRIRWVSHDRPGYGGSTPNIGRTVASVAGDVAAIADALGIGRFALMGHSGGGPHALACAALLSNRILGVVCGAGLAPFDADGLDWLTGMAHAGAAELGAAVRGREALRDHLMATEFDPDQFTLQDHAALAGAWSWLGYVAGRGTESGLDGMLDDDLAYVAPWGFAPEVIGSPVLYLYGGKDRIVPASHGSWLASHTHSNEIWLRPDAGHISILDAAEDALGWLVDHATTEQ